MAPFSTCLLVAIASACVAQVHSVGYYWRDFDGTIPADAVSAGSDRNNQQFFVGQALGFRGDKWTVSPVALTAGQTEYSVPIIDRNGSGQTNETYALKVLCSARKNNFQWVSTDNDDLKTVRNIVQGGWANEDAAMTPLYVGRWSIFGYPSVGSIQTENDYFRNYLRFPSVGPSFTPKFDVLTYQD